MIILHRAAGRFAIVALTLLSGCGAAYRDLPPRAEAHAALRDRAPRFAPGQLERHFWKHGVEMGFATMEEYLRAAQDLVRGGPGVEILHRWGDTLFFRAATGEVAILSSYGVIRTYFQPRDPERYWERQK